MTAQNRLRKEFMALQALKMPTFCQIAMENDNLLRWTGLIVPDSAPYDKGAFRIEINFPSDYPFRPPKILFRTKIYHPNIDENGQLCLPIINTENWKPTIPFNLVIQTVIALINEPEPLHALRTDLGEEFALNRKKFYKKAEQHTRKFSEKRPA